MCTSAYYSMSRPLLPCEQATFALLIAAALLIFCALLGATCPTEQQKAVLHTMSPITISYFVHTLWV